MTQIIYREAMIKDVPIMARLREQSGWEGGANETRMMLYLKGEHHPQHAKAPRIAFLAETDNALIGFIAGHLTTRFGCGGELQWLLVAPAHRGSTAATGLLTHLATWFAGHKAPQICVNVEPDNERARRFYRRHGAQEMETHWMIWPDITYLCAEYPLFSIGTAPDSPGQQDHTTTQSDTA